MRECLWKPAMMSHTQWVTEEFLSSLQNKVKGIIFEVDRLKLKSSSSIYYLCNFAQFA